jgi:DNA-directed RNA polymerase specialized sigma24 family protein
MPSLQPPGGDAGALAGSGAPASALHETVERLTERQIGEVYQFIYRYVGTRPEAERLTERVFLQAAPALRDLRARVSAPTRQAVDSLLAQTARATLADELRARYHATPESAARVVALIHADGPATTHASGESALAYAQGVLARLLAPERDLLTYRFLLNSPIESVAQVMGLSANGALALQWAALAHASQIVASDYQTMPAACERDA